MKTDPGPTNKTRHPMFDPRAIPAAPAVLHHQATLSGGVGATVRRMELGGYDDQLRISLHGWYTDVVTLNAKQIAFLFHSIKGWYPSLADGD